MAQPALKTIPIEQLHISKLNMRHGRKAPDVSDILPSIREKGIRQTLLVRPEGDGFGVVAGRRRFHALQVIAAETGKPVMVPCAIMEADDDAAAVEASLIENVARLPATEMEQYNAFGKLAQSGRTVDEIAGHFGVTELKVRRILALANLSGPIRALYAKDEIDHARHEGPAGRLARPVPERNRTRAHGPRLQGMDHGRNHHHYRQGAV